MIRSWLLALLTAQAMLLAGCATSKVWEDGQFARFHEPATPSNLLLFESSQRGDVLVEYDEWRDGDDLSRRRALVGAKHRTFTGGPKTPIHSGPT
jgi:hypothetical protein